MTRAAKDRYMPCPLGECGHEEWISPEDEDGSFSQLWRHVNGHTFDQTKTAALMATVREVVR